MLIKVSKFDKVLKSHWYGHCNPDLVTHIYIKLKKVVFWKRKAWLQSIKI